MSYLLGATLRHLRVIRLNSQPALQTRYLTSTIFKGTFTLRTRCLDTVRFSQKAPKQFLQVNFCTRPYELSTNVSKDVILFKYENPKFYKMLNIFAICQLIFWSYLSHFAYTTLRDAPVEQSSDTDLSWYQRINLGENKYRNAITFMCFGIGYGIFAASWLFTLRSVRFLVLRKGGQEVSFVTYGPFGQNRIMTVPLKNVSAQESRDAARVQLPIKVKNRALFFVLDMRGEFKNPQLFDYTAGLRRRI